MPFLPGMKHLMGFSASKPWSLMNFSMLSAPLCLISSLRREERALLVIFITILGFSAPPSATINNFVSKFWQDSQNFENVPATLLFSGNVSSIPTYVGSGMVHFVHFQSAPCTVVHSVFSYWLLHTYLIIFSFFFTAAEENNHLKFLKSLELGERCKNAFLLKNALKNDWPNGTGNSCESGEIELVLW